MLKRLKIPTWWGGRKVILNTDIVEDDVPWLIGLETLKNLRTNFHIKGKQLYLTLDNLQGQRIDCREDNTGHIRISLLPEINKRRVWVGWNWTKDRTTWKTNCKRLHLQFGHASFEKLKQLIKDGIGTKGETEEIKEFFEVLKEYCEKCLVCLKYKKNPKKPVVGLPLGTRFNDTVAIDLGDLDGERFMVIVDLMTKYTASTWVKNKTPEEITKNFINNWIKIFGTPNRILSDNGLEFQNEDMKWMTEGFGIEQLSTAAESPWSNGMCEKTVGILKETLRKMKEEGVKDKQLALSWAVNARNCLSMTGGFSPHQLVFGRNPSLPSVEDNLNPATITVEEGDISDIMRNTLESIHKSREIYTQVESSEKIKRALSHQIREHHLEDCQSGDRVFYKRENEKSWRGPATVVGRIGKTVVVKHGGTIREVARVHVTRIQKVDDTKIQKVENIQEQREDEPEKIEEQVEELQSESESESSETEEEQEEEETEQEEEKEKQVRIKKNKRYLIQDEEGNKKEVTILSRAGKATSNKWNNCYNVEEKGNGRRYWIDFNEHPNVEEIEDEVDVYIGFENKEVLQAKLQELYSWKNNKVYEEVPNSGQKIISTKWIVTEKIINGDKKCKARLVARGFEEDNSELTIDAPTCSGDTLKLCLNIINNNKWNVKSLDVKTAYLQGKQIERNVYLQPPKEARTDKIWKLHKAVYGLKDAARVWYDSVVEIIEEMKGGKSLYDQTIFYWKDKENNLEGIMCSHVDDFIYGGSREFETNVIEKIKNKLQIGSEEKQEFKYIGVNIKQEKDKIYLHQNTYINRIEIPDVDKYLQERNLSDTEKTEYRSLIGQINWVSQHTRPDMSFDVSNLSKGTSEVIPSRNMRKLIHCAKKMKDKKMNICIKKLSGKDLTLKVFSDASLGNREGGKSQIGYTLSIQDNENKENLLSWKSCVAKRVVRSAIEAEAQALSEGIEMAIYLKYIWTELTSNNIKIKAYTDSKTLERGIKSTSGVSSKMLRIEIARFKQMLSRREVETITWIPREKQIADALTREGVNKVKLWELAEGAEQNY